jgi:hypothetical protein
VSDEHEPLPEFDFEGYRRFIGQIHLRDIWLMSSRSENKRGPGNPEQAKVAIADEPSWMPTEDGFRAVVRYRLRFKEGAKTLASLEACFAADFASDEPMTDELFAMFAAVNLPLNTWPYLREFTAATLGRMGWLPFTLPAVKINAERS